MERQAKKIGKVVNYDKESKEITILEELFEYGDGMRGATGVVLVPVTKEEYEDKTNDVDAVAEYLNDSYGEVPEEYRMDGFRKMAEDIVNSCDAGNLFWDQSCSGLWKYIREELGLTEEEAYIFNCIRGCRIFNDKYQGNVNPELSELIREYETKTDKKNE